jgi:hypothetical protein
MMLLLSHERMYALLALQPYAVAIAGNPCMLSGEWFIQPIPIVRHSRVQA